MAVLIIKTWSNSLTWTSLYLSELPDVWLKSSFEMLSLKNFRKVKVTRNLPHFCEISPVYPPTVRFRGYRDEPGIPPLSVCPSIYIFVSAQ